jgi:hypothetical protein
VVPLAFKQIIIPSNVTPWKLWLDDFRVAPNDNWCVATDFYKAKALVEDKDFPVHVAFDHDLGIHSPTGYDFAHWLIRVDMDNGNMPADFSWSIQSDNPVGKENIDRLLTNYIRTKTEI